jgi:hypothetical protein
VNSVGREPRSFDLSSPPLFFAYILLPLAFLLLPLAFDANALARLGAEDGLFENIGAVAYLAASILFMIAYLRSSALTQTLFGHATKRNVYFLLLALLMFVCFGEEISWGQRIFAWDTPGWLASVNVQGETTIHNLQPFSAKDFSGHKKSFLQLLLNMNRLFAIFTLLYCIALPLTVRSWRMAARFVEFAGIPVPPLSVGGLFAAVYLGFQASIAIFGLPAVTALDELKESLYAAIFAVIAFGFIAWPVRRPRSVES